MYTVPPTFLDNIENTSHDEAARFPPMEEAGPAHTPRLGYLQRMIRVVHSGPEDAKYVHHATGELRKKSSHKKKWARASKFTVHSSRFASRSFCTQEKHCYKSAMYVYTVKCSWKLM